MIQVLTLIAVILFSPATPIQNNVPALNPDCDQTEVTPESRKDTRRRVQNVCKAVGASPIICAYMDAIVVRESSGRSGVRHTGGKNENGLGAMGLSLRWQKDKWPGDDEDPMFCSPEVSAIVALAIFHRALGKWKGQDLVDVQGIYGGHWECYNWFQTGDKPRRVCRARRNYRHVGGLCKRMKDRGFSCRTKITRKDLGRFIPRHERREFATNVANASSS